MFDIFWIIHSFTLHTLVSVSVNCKQQYVCLRYIFIRFKVQVMETEKSNISNTWMLSAYVSSFIFSYDRFYDCGWAVIT
jgi:hypothetical protein